MGPDDGPENDLYEVTLSGLEIMYLEALVEDRIKELSAKIDRNPNNNPQIAEWIEEITLWQGMLTSIILDTEQPPEEGATHQHTTGAFSDSETPPDDDPDDLWEAQHFTRPTEELKPLPAMTPSQLQEYLDAPNSEPETPQGDDPQ